MDEQCFKGRVSCLTAVVGKFMLAFRKTGKGKIPKHTAYMPPKIKKRGI